MDIYLLKNFTLKEVYFGLSEGELIESINSHKNNADSPVGHWNFEAEEVKWGKVEENLSELYAKAFLQALRREPPDEGWIIVFGMD